MTESSAAIPGSEQPSEYAQATPPVTPAAGASDGASPDPSGGGEAQTERTARTLIVALAVVCFAVFWWVGIWLDIPRHRGHEASLMQQSGAGKVLAIVIAALLFVGCTVGVHLVAGRRWLYAGPFAAAVGLVAWSLRGGPSRYVYFHAADEGRGQSIFLLLALELLLLSAIVGAVWYLFATAARAIRQGDLPASEASVSPMGRRLQALAFQVLLTAIAVTIFAPVDAKKEVMAAVFLGCFVGASLTEYFFGKDDLEAWYWLGPALVGVLGYVLNYFSNAAGAPDVTGHLTGLFAPLSRPLPLDYASAGMVGALLGFWTGGEHPEIAVGILLLSPRFRSSNRKTPIQRFMDQG